MKPAADDRGTARDAEAAVRVLARILATDGGQDPCDIDVAQKIAAEQKLGVPAERFLELWRDELRDFCTVDCSWLPAGEESRVDGLLDAVVDPQCRRTVCALAIEAMGAAGRVGARDHLLLRHALARWQVDHGRLGPDGKLETRG
jgi:hypothetical protein